MDLPATPEEKKKDRWRVKIAKTLLFFIPKSNPDNDNLIGDVAEWQLEIDADNKLTAREIGKDINGKIILVSPWRNNMGLWTDSDITLEYFKDHFKAVNIDKQEFIKNWDDFIKNNPDYTE